MDTNRVPSTVWLPTCFKIYFCVQPEKKDIHTGSEKLEAE